MNFLKKILITIFLSKKIFKKPKTKSVLIINEDLSSDIFGGYSLVAITKPD